MGCASCIYFIGGVWDGDMFSDFMGYCMEPIESETLHEIFRTFSPLKF